jgi:DNA-directed RNA polymerase subunit RPC12/RpoP
MRGQPTIYFVNSAMALLTAFATALFLGNVANAELTQPYDPLFAVPINLIFWIFGAVSMAVAIALVCLPQPRFKLMVILWFAANVIVYRLEAEWQGANDLRSYLGGLAHAFNLSNGFNNRLLNLLFLYLAGGSVGLLLWQCLARPEEVPLKAICGNCGGHIAFSTANLGQRISCPHCQKTTVLHEPGNLKMSCFFCKKHIEFPAHALGQKIKCPHCEKDITLKESA